MQRKLPVLADFMLNYAFGNCNIRHMASTECICQELDYLLEAVSSPRQAICANLFVGREGFLVVPQKNILNCGWDWTLDQILSSHLVKLWILPKPLFRMDLWVYLRWKSLLLEPRYELILSHVTLPDNLDWCGRAPTPVKGPFLDANHNIYDLGQFNNLVKTDNSHNFEVEHK
ncbi:hypothetical protein Tco_0213010 [Tanacetum coccineum]